MCYLSCQLLEKVKRTVAPKLNGEAGASSMPTSSTLVDPTVISTVTILDHGTQEKQGCVFVKPG